jgi:hypothetical protein
LANADFELDDNADGLPDNWSSDSHATRSGLLRRSGSYAMQHRATDNTSYTVSQNVTHLTAGLTYAVAAWVNIPATSDVFTFTLEVQWRDISNNLISTSVIKTYTATTIDWDQAAANLLVPAGTTTAQVRMVVSSLNATIYIDDTSFQIDTMLANASFELDTNGDGNPDSWSTNSRVTRDSSTVHSGSYAMRHSATDNSGYTISQSVNNLNAGQAYSFSGWVNIPPTSDTFTFKIDVQWQNASNAVISTKTVKSYTAQTSGWNQATANLVAPAGTTSAHVRMVVSSLNATVYADDFVLQPSSLLENGGFEWDTDNNGRPDSWSGSSKFVRGAEQFHRGGYAGKHAATDNSGYTISQTVTGLSAGVSYSVSGWVNIPATPDTFSFTIQVLWRDSSNTTLRTDLIKSYGSATGGVWDQATATVTAPIGATNAQVQMVITSLNAIIYVDDFSLRP